MEPSASMKCIACSKFFSGISGNRSAASWNGAYSIAPPVSSRHRSIQRRQKWQSPSKISSGFLGGLETDERDIAPTFGLPRRTSTPLQGAAVYPATAGPNEFKRAVWKAPLLVYSSNSAQIGA